MRGLDRGKRREPRLPATAGSSALSCAWRGERGKRKYPVLKSSFAYCASRRRVFGSANNGGLPLSTSLSSFSLSASSSTVSFSRRTRVLDHAHASRSIIAERRFLEARARAKPEGSSDSRREREPVDHPRSRTSGLVPRSPRAFPRSFTRFPFI